MLHPHPEARFQTREQMQAHIKGVFRRMGEPAKRLAARQRELDAMEAAKAADRKRKEEADLEAAAARLKAEAAHGPKDVRDIVRAVAVRHGVTSADIMGRGRDKTVVAARWAAVAAVKAARPSWSTTRLGMFFDRDHTTIMHALKMHAERSR